MYEFYNVYLLGCDCVHSGRYLQVFSAKSVSLDSAGSSEISVNFYHITWHDIVDDIT